MPQQEMIFSDYLRVIAKRKVTIITMTILVSVCTYFYSTKTEPVYTSSARIKIQRFQTFAQLFDEVLVSSGDPIENYIYEIAGNTVLNSAVEIIEENYPENLTANLQGAITAERIPKTDLIDITVKGPSAKVAQNRCDAVVKAFQKIHGSTINANTQAEHDNIQQSLDSTINELNKEDENFSKIISAQATNEYENNQIQALTTRLADTQLKLKNLQSEGNYTDAYPPIIVLKEEISGIHEQIQKLPGQNREAAALTRNHEQKRDVLEKMIVYLTQRLEETRISLNKKSERITVITEPCMGAPVTTAIAYMLTIGALLGLMLGILLAFVAETLDSSLRTLSEIEATFNLRILGVIPHFSPYTADVPIHPESIWDKIKYSDFIIIWRALFFAFSKKKKYASKTNSKLSNLIVPFSPRSPATEGYRTIRTNLILADEKEKVGALLITSAGPAEGKSTTIANLALAFAQAGKKTLLVGGNMRRPSLERTFGLSREPGLSEVLVGDMSWRDVMKDHRDLAIGERQEENLATAPGIENLFFIMCGGRTIQPSEWLSRPSFQITVREWESEFDVVLIDGTPILPVPDSIIMAAAVGKVALVYQVGSTQRDSMLRAIALIEGTGAKISGLIVNDLRASWGSSPDFYHYRGYYGRPEKK